MRLVYYIFTLAYILLYFEEIGSVFYKSIGWHLVWIL